MTEPAADCPLCPRLVAYRAANRLAEPDWFNAPAPSFGDPLGRLLIVGLAPGRTGANRTGRTFTGDGSGQLLFDTLVTTGFATGRYDGHPADGLTLVDCLVTNAVRCAPPGNRPDRAEERACRPFLAATIRAMPRLQVIVTLGDVARRNVLAALGLPHRPATHGDEQAVASLRLLHSYHCSRLNTNTGRLTPAMLEAVFRRA